MQGVSLRLTNVFGPGPKSSSSDRGILNLMVNKALRGEELTIYGTGEYIGRGMLKKKTHRKLWKEHLSMERNMQLYGMNAWSTSVDTYTHESVKKLFETLSP